MAADFEKASRQKIRFNTVQGTISVEDLWDLPLTSVRGLNLNDIAKGISKQIKDAGEEDFVDNVKKPNEVLSLKLDLVKRVIEVKKDERDAAEREAARKAEKQRILELIDEKRDEKLKGKTEEELREMLAKL